MPDHDHQTGQGEKNRKDRNIVTRSDTQFPRPFERQALQNGPQEKQAQYRHQITADRRHEMQPALMFKIMIGML